jgi:RHS repeat-associated protein
MGEDGLMKTLAGATNNKQFVRKEKDKETGLYYFGARYMNDKIGRFISVDPIGPVDEKTGKVNEKMLLNPQRLNRYAYGLNNPYRYVDRDGMWGEDVHSGIDNYQKGYGTYYWARQAGFSDKEARIIARGNNATDAGPWSNWLPLLGDQSRHFNQPYLFSKGIGDTRDYWANVEFQRALKYAKEGNYEAALGHLGVPSHINLT